MKDLIFAIGFLTILIITFSLMGCSGTIEKMRDPVFTQGCVFSEAQTKLGYFNQEGMAEIAKFKCSPELPKDYFFLYENPRSGFIASVGTESE